MAMNLSGPISLAGTTAGQSIEIENGGNGTTQISLNDVAVRALARVPSGAITMPTDFYGKANEFELIISTNQTNLNLRSYAVSQGWDQAVKVIATINNGVAVSSNATGTPALTINGSFPEGIELINNGTIVGMGGAGGAGGAGLNGPMLPGSAGNIGGNALTVAVATTVENNGVIAGGGGGGGGGGAGSPVDPCGGVAYAGGSGGGGGRSSNAANSAGGAAGYGFGYGCGNFGGAPGSVGTYSVAGNGGTTYADGGAGGSWGATGTTGATGTGGFGGAAGGVGGAGGSATSGSATYITWTATGTRFGAIN